MEKFQVWDAFATFLTLLYAFIVECEEESVWINRGISSWCEVDCTQLHHLQWQYVIFIY